MLRETLEGGLTFGHNVPQLEDRHQVVNVTVDALRHTRVLQAQRTRELTNCRIRYMLEHCGTRKDSYLYFHGYLPAVVHGGSVDLSDGGCSQGSGVKLL